MKFIIIFISGFVLINALPSSKRLLRDVSHLDLSYLPPPIPKLKEYLPPAENKKAPINEKLPPTPSQEYLPPTASGKDLQFVTEKPDESTTVVITTETLVQAELLPPTNDYLPPVAEIKQIEEVVTKQEKLPTNDYLPPINMGEDISEIPLEPFPINNENTEVKASHSEESSGEVVELPDVTTQTTAVKEADGYHYKIPENIPDLFPPKEENIEYLPPLENDVVEVEGPANGETAILKDDGYHYRTIKRRF